ncbi:hypothetical protein KC850_02030 [Candidatus Kaiserbacteria bacterium]|nr:hypothetical protein [Candidatus Kaiserbacteria bacterium]
MKQMFVRVFYLATVALLFIVPSSVQAASLYIDPPFSTLFSGDSVTLAVRLDTDEAAGECINAVDAKITYPANVEPVDISIGKSIFNIWVEQPKINKQERTITFAGGIPNGYCGRVSGDPRLTNTLVEVVFRSPGFTIGGGSSDSSEAVVTLSDESTAYLNDGRGTKVSLALYPAKISLEKGAGSALVNQWQEEVDADVVPPEDFSILLQKGEGNFSNKYYIIFNTTDKQTGVDQYQVMEEPLTQFGTFQWGRADAPWVEARSPYVLKDQSLNSIVRVKAIDKAGNEYVATLIPDGSMRTLSSSQILTVALTVVSLVVLLAVGFISWRVIRNRRKERINTDDDYENDETAASNDNEIHND